jgi:hypothetical protein
MVSAVVVVMVFHLNSIDEEPLRELSLSVRDIVAVAGGVVIGIVIWFVVLKRGAA